MNTRPALTPQQGLFVSLITDGLSIRDTAKAMEVGASTCTRWLRQPKIQAALREATNTALDAASAKLAGGAATMLETLEVIAQDRSVPPGVRVRAAEAWLGAALRFAEQRDLAARLAELERMVLSEQGAA